jgi:hypothetical protein
MYINNVLKYQFDLSMIICSPVQSPCKPSSFSWCLSYVNYIVLTFQISDSDRMVVGFTTMYAISVYHTDVVSSNLDQDEVYNIMW